MSTYTSKHAESDRCTDCDRCGRDRPANPERFAIVASDTTDATIAYEKTLLCRECWQHARDDLRRSITR